MGWQAQEFEGQQVAVNLQEAARGGKDRARAVAVEVLGDRRAMEALAEWVAEGDGGGALASVLLLMRGVRGCAGVADTLERHVQAGVRAREKVKGDPRAVARRAAEEVRERDFQRMAGAAGLDWEPQLPQGWACSERGVWAVDEDGVRRGEVAARYPVLLVGMQEAEGEELVEVTWSKDLGVTWQRAGLKRSVARSAQAMVVGAQDGVPVDSGTAAALVRWLGDLEAANAVRMPTRRVALRLGWVGEGFVAGRRFVGRPGVKEVVGLADGGALKDLGAALEPSGTWEGWREVFAAAVAGRPAVALGVLASVASVLLQVCAEPGFTLSFDGGSGGGKSTTLRLAVSVWGRAEGYWRKWDTTAQGVEDLAHLLRHLPLVLDETQLAAGPEMVRRLLYQVPEGTGRLKGTRDGAPRQGKDWRLVMIASGEQSILSFASGAAGAAARTLSISGHPFGRAAEGSAEEAENARVARACEAGAMAHCGHLGVRVVEQIMRADVGRLKARLHELNAWYSGQAAGVAARRVMRHVAMLRLAQEVAEAAGMPVLGDGPVGVAFEAAVASGRGADKARAALDEVAGWVWACAKDFQRSVDQRPGPHGWLGRIDGQRVYIRKAVLEEQLKAWGYEADGVITTWADRGWMELGADGRKAVLKRTTDGDRIRFYGVHLWALNGEDPPKAATR